MEVSEPDLFEKLWRYSHGEITAKPAEREGDRWVIKYDLVPASRADYRRQNGLPPHD